jgi:structural maintenance of chromosome 1
MPSQREREIDDRLQDVLNRVLQAEVDQRESHRETKLKETLNNLRRIFPGVHGRIVDLCKPVATKYETAVMTVLGRHLDAVVVDQDKTAMECIEYMKQQRAGIATFIPLDVVQVKPVPEKLRNLTRGSRLAIDCIEFDSAVERAMQHACGSAMICDTLAIAKTICFEKRQDVKGEFSGCLVRLTCSRHSGGHCAWQEWFHDWWSWPEQQPQVQRPRCRQ